MVVFALYMCALFALSAGHVYERCELARELSSLGVDKDHLATWVCIAFHESRYDTAARNPHSGDHGLLQISEIYWCGPGKACGLPCSALRDEDISDDVQCAHRIYKEHTRLQGDGFLAWVVYQHHCKHNAKKYLVDCEGHLKNVTIKSDNRGRSLRTGRPKDTRARPFYSNHPDIDKVQPPYLAINVLLERHFDNQVKENYDSDNQRINWLNYKIDNIDSLQLPEFAKKGFVQFTTSSTTTTTIKPTTTTIDPYLIGIKPPMPRRIETNQFRRKTNVNGANKNMITADKNNNVINKTSQTVFSQNNYFPLTSSNTSLEPHGETTTNNPILIKSNTIIIENSSMTTKIPFVSAIWETTNSPMTALTVKTPYVSPTAQPSTLDKDNFADITVAPIEKTNASYEQTSIVKPEIVASSNISTNNFNTGFRPFTFNNVYNNWTSWTRKFVENTISPVTNSVDEQITIVTPKYVLLSNSATENNDFPTARPLSATKSYQFQTSKTASTVKSNITNTDQRNYHVSTAKPFTTTSKYNIPIITSKTEIQSNLSNTVTKNYYFTTAKPLSTTTYKVPTSTLMTKPQSVFTNVFARDQYFTTTKPTTIKSYNVPTSTVTTEVQRNLTKTNDNYYFTTAKSFTTTTKRYEASPTTKNVFNFSEQMNKVSQSQNGQTVKGFSNVTEVKSNDSLLGTFTNKSNLYSNYAYSTQPKLSAINVWSNGYTTTARPQTSTWPWRRFSAEKTANSSQRIASTTSYTASTTTVKTIPALSSTPKTNEQIDSLGTTTTRKPSIFDLYLRPQQVAVTPFQFTLFKNSRSKSVIFAGGTTAPPKISY